MFYGRFISLRNSLLIMEQKIITLENITLLKALFNREHNIVVDNEKVKPTIDIDVSYSDLTQEKFAVFLDVSYKALQDDVVIVEIYVRQAGLFNVGTGQDMASLENFASINAPAIIFPFVRENIASLSSKGGVGNILIQPVNFVELNKIKPSKKNPPNEKI